MASLSDDQVVLWLEPDSVTRPGAAIRPHRGHGKGGQDTERDPYHQASYGDRDQQAVHG